MGVFTSNIFSAATKETVLAELSRLKRELEEAQTRLQLYKNVSAELNSEMAVDAIIERTVLAIHAVFPSLRIAYSTVTPQLKVKVAYSVSPAHMPSLQGLEFQLDASDRYVIALKKMTALVVEDVALEPLLDAVREKMRMTGAGAIIVVPLRHPQLEFGLVCCDAAEPRHWREYEIATLTDMSEYLALAIRQAHAKQEHAGMERQLRDSQKMEAVGRLVGGIAHDFNNLLTAMMIYCGLLSTSLGKAHRLHGHVDQIRQAGERGANLVAQLLALTKQQVLEPRIVTISAVIEDMRDMLQRVIGEDVVLLTGCSEDLRSTRVDAAQLEQVILNMAINARDAMPDGGQLSIDCSNVELEDESAAQQQLPPGQYVQLRIADTGHGMDEKTIARIFDPFFTTKGQGKGTGLGLSTAYGIIKQHGGNISVISEPGQGAVFTVLLPSLTSPADEAAQVENEAKGISVSRGEMILLVEDEALVRLSLVETLRGVGYQVLEAAGGEEALALSDRYDGNIPLLITDLVMPGMNGRQVADAITKRRPEISVLFISGYSDDPRTRAMLGEGCDFFRKPFTAEALRKKVRQILDRRLQDAAPSPPLRFPAARAQGPHLFHGDEDK